MNIDQIAMRYISMDLSRQALQTYGKFFSNFGVMFRINYHFKNNSDVGFMHARWGEPFVLISTRSSFLTETVDMTMFFNEKKSKKKKT